MAQGTDSQVGHVDTISPDGNQKVLKHLSPEVKQELKSLKESITPLRQETKRLAEDLKQDRAQLKELVAQARQNKNQDKLKQLKQLKEDANIKAIIGDTKTLREQKKQAWSEMRQAISQNSTEGIKAAGAKIINLKTLINQNLTQLDSILKQALTILH